MRRCKGLAQQAIKYLGHLGLSRSPNVDSRHTLVNVRLMCIVVAGGQNGPIEIYVALNQ